MAILKFADEESVARLATVLVFDVAGFSHFCNHADRHANLPKFISRLFSLFDQTTVARGPYAFTNAETNEPRIIFPDAIKFTGDGALVLWTSDTPDRFDERFRTLLVASMRRFQANFADAVVKWENELHISGIPRSIRIALTMGTVYELESSGGLFGNSSVDYVGYCINLAFRLQNHCRELGFAIHKSLAPKIDGIELWEAVNIKGAGAESVYVFSEDARRVAQNERYWKTKFRPNPQTEHSSGATLPMSASYSK